jgi:hypothetical protein
MLASNLAESFLFRVGRLLAQDGIESNGQRLYSEYTYTG